MRINPFTYGKPISDPARFVGRQREVWQVLSAVASCQAISLVTEYRMGKTSLLNYLAHPTVHQAYGLDPNKFLFVHVNLQLVNKDTTPSQLWQHILQQIAQNCQNDEQKQMLEQAAQMNLSDGLALNIIFDRFDKLAQESQIMVLMFSEFDKIAEHQNFTEDFFHTLRAIHTYHSITFIISSCRNLFDFNYTDSSSLRGSPFFNIFSTIFLSVFTEGEARSLISSLLAPTDISFTDLEIDTLLRVAGYHPYFLQVASHFLFEAYNLNLGSDERTSFWQRPFSREAAPHLKDYWLRSSDRMKIVLTALALLEQQKKGGGVTFNQKQLQALYTGYSRPFSELEWRGLVVRGGNDETYHLLNTALRDWICEEITDTMHDKQSYDEWLRTHEGVMKRIWTPAKKEMTKILPRIGSNYRDLIVTWMSDPKNITIAATLLKALLGIH